MLKKYNPPVSIQIYLGSGKSGEKLRENLITYAGRESISEAILKLLKKIAPELFKGVNNGRK